MDHLSTISVITQNVILTSVAIFAVYTAYRELHKWRDERKNQLRIELLRSAVQRLVEYRMILGQYKKTLDGLAGKHVQNFRDLLEDFSAIDRERAGCGGSLIIVEAEARAFFGQTNLPQALAAFLNAGTVVNSASDAAQVKYFRQQGVLEIEWLDTDKWSELNKTYLLAKGTVENLLEKELAGLVQRS